ncbi:MAG: hypothetical protein A2498_07440 [Lentisphaerae bacterium RIFOXYC12_FULL_60_16]|nr:MAG: hypothetical protein A2498_07440 [Lentisphaerae bacterium RIFOXYC12_FULL_60_16]
MDPYGNYDCFMIEARTRARYRLDEIVSLLPYRLRLERSFTNHPFYPPSLPLMKRPDDRDTGLDFFDIVALVDVGPGAFTVEDIRTLKSYVESGKALLVFGGPNSFGEAVATYGIFDGFLPVTVSKEKKVIKPSPPVLKGPFAKFSKDLGSFGRVSNIQVVKPAKNSQVLAEAAGRPLLIAGPCGLGRIMVIPTFPDVDDGNVLAGAPDSTSFFGSDGYANLMGLCISWLLRRDQDLCLTGFRAPTADVTVGRALDISIKPRLKHASARFALRKAGNEITLDRDPEFRKTVMEASHRLKPGIKAVVHHALAESPQASGIYRCHMTMEGNGEGKEYYRYYNLGFYNIKVPEHGYNAKVSRIATFNVSKKTGFRVYPVGYHNALTAGDTMELVVERIGKVPANATLTATLTRPTANRERITVAGNLPVQDTFSYVIPDLQPDDYLLEVTLATGRKVLDTVEMPVVVVAPLREEETMFCAVSQAAGLTSSAGMRAWFNEMVENGFNCFTLNNVSRLSLDKQKETNRNAVMESLWSETVQKNGFPLWAEYSRTVILSTHSWQDKQGEKPTEPCPYTPPYRAAARTFIRDRMDATRYFPRLVSMEILDEPHLYAANIDYSKPALAAFKKRYGYSKPDWKDYLAFRDRRRMDYFNSAIDYAETAFKASYEEVEQYLREHHRKYPHIHHVYAQGGIHHPGIAVFEQLNWSKHCHSIEFDSYPWLYGNFRAWDKIRMGEPRYMFAYYRVLADYLDKPIGFFVETNDFYYPLEIWPANSSNELLYLAVGCGTKRFHTMILGIHGNLNGLYEREKALAKELRRIMEIAPLAAVAKPRRTNLGVLNAWADHLYNVPSEPLPGGLEGLGFYPMRNRPYDRLYPNFVEPLNGLEVIYRAYGALPDVVDERILKSELPRYQAFTLIGAVKTMLPESFERLWNFVHAGGVLVMDGIPCETTNGGKDDRFSHVFPPTAKGTWRNLAEGLRVRDVRVGKGQILLIDGDLHDLMSRSYEKDIPMLREELVRVVSEFLETRRIVADACSSNPEGIGVYEMTAEATRILTVINHTDSVASSTIALKAAPDLPRPALLIDYISGRRLRFSRTKEGVQFGVTLASREGMIVGVYPDVPMTSTLTVTPHVRASRKWNWEFRMLNKSEKPARGSYPASVQVYSPSGKRMKCFERFVPAVNGILQGEFVMPLNPEIGAWKVTAFNKVTLENLSATFTVRG